MLPITLEAPINELLYQHGDRTEIQFVSSVGGGCINQAIKIETEIGKYFLKWNNQSHKKVFSIEADGLKRLSATETIAVPEVLGFSETQEGVPAFILLTWMKNETGTQINQRLLGEKLALLHKNNVADQYGLSYDNFLGSSLQINTPDVDWVRFYQEKRLLPQLITAQKNGFLPLGRQQKFEKFISNLDQYLQGRTYTPSLLHGDLWSGNVIAGNQGEPVLIDPAIYYGDREAEIAYTELFGGFSREFYNSYQEVWPLEPGYEVRRDVYNLYHLFNHLNIFGSGYATQVDAILNRFVK
jgi:fructosamine-3-kinase